jgi:DNA repair protein RadC
MTTDSSQEHKHGGTPRAPRTKQPQPDRVLREALAPYIDVPKLRRLAAAGDDLQQALRSGVEPPPEVQALLNTLVLLLTPIDHEPIRGPADAVAFLMLRMGYLDQEHFCVLCLNTRNRIQKLHTVYVGSLNASMIRVGEIFKEPLRLNSAGIILIHNHPSSICDPSPEDLLVTRAIVQAGDLLDCPVMDHLIVGAGRWISLRERGLGFEKR